MKTGPTGPVAPALYSLGNNIRGNQIGVFSFKLTSMIRQFGNPTFFFRFPTSVGLGSTVMLEHDFVNIVVNSYIS